MNRLALSHLTVLTLMTLVLLSLGSDKGLGYATPSTVEISLDSLAPYYQPYVAVLSTERAVKWFNPTASPHTIRHDGCATEGPCAFNSGAVPPGGSYTVSSLPAGRYSYHCELHPVMRGELLVENPEVLVSESR